MLDWNSTSRRLYLESLHALMRDTTTSIERPWKLHITHTYKKYYQDEINILEIPISHHTYRKICAYHQEMCKPNESLNHHFSHNWCRISSKWTNLELRAKLKGDIGQCKSAYASDKFHHLCQKVSVKQFINCMICRPSSTS